MITSTLKTPIGTLYLASTDYSISFVSFKKPTTKLEKHFSSSSLLEKKEKIKAEKLLSLCKIQITEFLEKKRTEFTLPLDCQGTPFQKDVWNYLKNIPYGKTLSYSEMAQKMNIPTSTRAIAKALSQNPLSLLLPCHRIIGKSGKLTGYAGGIMAKKHLLSLEQNS